MAKPHIQSGECKPLPPLGIAIGQARTHALLKAEQLELVHLVLPKGRQLSEHKAPGEITLFAIEGEMRVAFDGRIRHLTAGSVIHLSAGIPHAVEALTDASALLTICLLRPASLKTPTHIPGESHEHCAQY